MPPQVVLEKLASWSEHPDGGVRHFSGSAVYVKSFTVPTAMIAATAACTSTWARLRSSPRSSLNGHSLGVLWKPPFRVEIGGAVRPGENELEVESDKPLGQPPDWRRAVAGRPGGGNRDLAQPTRRNGHNG